MDRTGSRRRPAAVIAVVALALVGCSGGTSTPQDGASTSASGTPSSSGPSASGSAVPATAPGSDLAFQYDGRVQVQTPSGVTSVVAQSAPPKQEHPDWSPDGSRIVFETDFTLLWVAEADGSKATQVYRCARPCYSIQDAAWSPDGRSIAFAAAETEDGGTTSRSAVLRLDLATQTVTTVYADTSHRVWLYSPRWSPDGTHLVVDEETFASDKLDESTVTASKVGIVRAEAAKPSIRYVATAAAGRISGVDWSPRGDLLVIGRDDNLVTLRTDGTGAAQITAYDAATRHAVQPTFTGARLTCAQNVTSKAVSVTTLNASTHAFTAYVAQDCGAADQVPTNDVRSTSTVSVTNAGWTGAVSMAASPATTNANAPGTTLTATTTKSVAAPYLLSIWDDSGARLTCMQAQTSAAIGITTPDAATHVYTAYVALDCGLGSTLPGNPVRSATVSVSNLGWTGTVTIAASPPITNVNAPGTNLNVTTSRSVAAPYYLSVFDDDGARLTCAQSVTTTSVPIWTTASRTTIYTAYVARDCGTDTEPPANPVTLAPVTVTNEGWTGRLNVSSSGMGPNFAVTSALSIALAAPYMLSVWDDAGNSYLCTSSTSTVTFDTSVTPPSTGTRTYTAYIAQDCGSNGPPTNDVRASSGVSFTGASPLGAFVAGVNLKALAFDLDARGVSICADLGTAPGTHTQGSVSDQGAAAMTACQSGSSATAWLPAVVASVGTAVGTEQFVTWLWALLHPTSAPPAPQANPNEPAPGEPSVDPGRTTGTDADYIEWLAAQFVNRPGLSMTVQQARIAARQCNAVRQFALARSVLFPTGGADPCDKMALYLPGTEKSTVQSEQAALDPQNPVLSLRNAAGATVHNWSALTGAPYADGTRAPVVNPSWFVLNYTNVPPVPEKWYNTSPTCLGRPTGWPCDEFPMRSTLQASTGSSLRVMSTKNNSSAGGYYRAFTGNCLLPPGAAFFIVPMPFAGMPTTKYVCNNLVP
jgi:Tol biopolymer transport system component